MSDVMRPAGRLALLADPDSVLALGDRAQTQQASVTGPTPADGLHTAFVRVAGLEAIALLEDAEVLQRTDGEVARAKLQRMLAFAVSRELPVVLVVDGPAGPPPLFEPGEGELHGRMTDPSLAIDVGARVAPLVAVVLGPAVGRVGELLGDADLVIATSETADASADLVAPDAAGALRLARQALAILGAREGRAYPLEAPEETGAGPLALDAAIELLVDADPGLSLAHQDGVIGRLGRIGGWPAVVAGASGPLSAAGLARIRRLVRLTGRCGVPLVLVQDCGGYAPDAARDRDAIARLVAEYRAWSNPRIVVVSGAGHVLGSFALGARQLGVDFVIAWPWARLAVTDPASYEEAALARVRQVDPWRAAGMGLVDDVLTPAETVVALRRLAALLGRALPQRREGVPFRVHDA